jgi:hypothetical protein
LVGGGRVRLALTNYLPNSNINLQNRQTQQYCGNKHESKVLVNRFGFTKTCFVLALQGASQNFLPKLVFFSVTNQNFYQNSHRQSETKIAKTSLTGTTPTYVEIKKREKSFGRLQASALGVPPFSGTLFPLILPCMYLPRHWLALSLVQYALTIQDSWLRRLRSDACSLTNHCAFG